MWKQHAQTHSSLLKPSSVFQIYPNSLSNTECRFTRLAFRINSACCISQQTKEKVKLLIQLADNFVEKGHVHVTELKKWVSTVDRRYRDFSQRMGQYRCGLENALGISTEVRKHLLTIFSTDNSYSILSDPHFAHRQWNVNNELYFPTAVKEKNGITSDYLWQDVCISVCLSFSIIRTWS